MGIPEKIKAIEDEIHKTQINKATEFHIGILKAKIARLKREMEDNTHGKILSAGGASAGFDVRKAGDATIVLVGLPSVGKSTLLNRLTNAESRVATYQFTTLTVIPGMMDYNGSRIQILDMPGIIEGAAAGKGLGRRVLSVARTADLVLIVLDVFQLHHLPVIMRELSEIGIKVNQTPPDVVVKKTSTGGVSVNIQVPTKITENFVKEVLRTYGIHNGQVTIREHGLTDDQLIDVLSGNRVYLPSVTVLNKIDLVDEEFLKKIRPEEHDIIPVSADTGINIEKLKESIYKKLDFIRIYMRPKGGQTDYKEPMIMRNGSTVGDVCRKVHRNMIRDFRYAQVWGKSAKFDAQKVGLDHKLIDQDVLTVVKKITPL